MDANMGGANQLAQSFLQNTATKPSASLPEIMQPQGSGLPQIMQQAAAPAAGQQADSPLGDIFSSLFARFNRTPPESYDSPASFRRATMPRGVLAPMSTGDANVMDFGQAAEGMRAYNSARASQNNQGGAQKFPSAARRMAEAINKRAQERG